VVARTSLVTVAGISIESATTLYRKRKQFTRFLPERRPFRKGSERGRPLGPVSINVKGVSSAYLNLLALPPSCQFSGHQPNYVLTEWLNENDNDKTIRLPESAPLHLVLVLVAHFVRLRVQKRCQKRCQFLVLILLKNPLSSKARFEDLCQCLGPTLHPSLPARPLSAQ